MRPHPSRTGTTAKIFLFVTGLALVIHATGTSLLPYVGKRVMGDITTIRRELGERQDPVANRYSYAVGYEFSLPDGQVIPGNTKVIGSSFSAGISKGPAAIRYLPGFPWLNALEQETGFNSGKAVLLAAGTFLCFAAIRTGRTRPTASRRSATRH